VKSGIVVKMKSYSSFVSREPSASVFGYLIVKAARKYRNGNGIWPVFMTITVFNSNEMA